MNAKVWLVFFVLMQLPVPVRAQDSVRKLGGAAPAGAFLTPGQLDRWVFDGEKGETVIAHVVSREFDPVLGLSRTGGKLVDMVLLDVDDPGNESRYMIRLPEKGEYKIRVQAFKNQGGGNYTLAVRRIQAEPLELGKGVIGTFDREGKSYHFFQGVKDQILIPSLKGTSPEAWSLLDLKGKQMAEWAGTVLIEESGECCLVVSGQPDYRYEILVRGARQQNLTVGKDVAGALQPGELDVLSFQGVPGDFRVLEVEKKGELISRLKYAPLEKKSEQRIGRAGDRPEIEFLPMASRGGRLRYAAILGRKGRYQLQLLAATSASYQMTARDPSVPIDLGKDVDGNVPVGGAAFYSFKATPGQLFQANLSSQKFVPILRLYDRHGTLVGSSGQSADGLEGRITHMVVSTGLYRLQVASLGDGGGGEFRQSLKETKLKELQVGGRGQGAIQSGTMDFWSFAGVEGKTVFLSVRSAAFEPTVSLRSPDGVPLIADNKGSAGAGSLLAILLPKTGRYTVWIASQRGAGEYSVRLIDGD